MSLEVVLGELTRARSLAFEAADSLEGVAYVPSTGSEATFGSPVLASAAQAFCLELEDVVRGHAARAEQTAEALGAAAADYARADQEVETQVGALAGGLGTVAPGIGWGADSPYRQQGPSSQTSEEIYQRLAKRLRGDQPAEGADSPYRQQGPSPQTREEIYQLDHHRQGGRHHPDRGHPRRQHRRRSTQHQWHK